MLKGCSTIIPSAQLRFDAQFIQCFDHWFGKLLEVVEAVTIVLGDEAEVQVTEIMINGPSARESTNNMQPLLFHVVRVDLHGSIHPADARQHPLRFCAIEAPA